MVRKYRYKIQKNIMEPGNIVILELAPGNGGDVFDFKAGQYAMLSFRDSKGRLLSNHSFSIASSPTNRDHLQFGIKVCGKFTQKLSKLKEGSYVFVTGPYGKFVFNERKHKDVVHIAGGIGITPFLSTARYITDKKLPNKITLLYSGRKLESTTFLEEIRELDEMNPNFDAVFAITDEVTEKTLGACEVENSRIGTDIINKYASPVYDKTFLLCGPPGFMEAMRNNLIKMGVRKERILNEGFSMNPKLPLKENLINLLYAGGISAVLLFFFLNFVYKEELNKKKLSNFFASSTFSRLLGSEGGVVAVNESLAIDVNNAILDRRNKLLASSQATTNQLNLQKTVFKQSAATGGTTVTQPTTTAQPTTSTVSAPTPTPTPVAKPAPKPKTTVS